MPKLRRFAAVSALIAVAIVVSGYLYVRSRSADFGGHARVIETIGSVRHLNERLSEQVLAARFGLLNQYDPIIATELALSDAARDLDRRVASVVGDGQVGVTGEHLLRLARSTARHRAAVERFQAENSVLKNSLFYLPNAAEELEARLFAPGASAPAARAPLALAVHRLVQAALVSDLVGDQGSGTALERAITGLEAQRAAAPPAQLPSVDSLLAHARVIARKLPSVDSRVKEVIDGDVNERLSEVESAYLERFGAAVASSNRYRKILYAWSLVLLVAAGAAGILLRRLYAHLEQRVVERTAELEKALSALWGEMKLARKIQEALVPRAPTLVNCDIAARMQPTDDVGGDYYDVIQTGGTEWILIGDVSGHGVSAGLIMMMCHTAVRTILFGQPDIRPDELLARVNTVLTENMRQLGEDKYMTITAFRRDPDGTLLFAGAHQDIQIYRAETGLVETLESSGIWLGLKDRIGHLLATRHFQLAPGDVFVLYTDGIVEASRDGAMFEAAGVREILGQAGGKSAGLVLSELFAALEGFTVDDDATLLVLRQLDGRSDAAREVVPRSSRERPSSGRP